VAAIVKNSREISRVILHGSLKFYCFGVN